jgi:hypothetical protein
MDSIKKVAGFSWGIVAFMIVLVTFPASRGLEERFVQATGLSISARMNGGEVRQTLDRGAYVVEIHRPVFDGLIGERENGFILIRVRHTGEVPAVIEEKVDYLGEGKDAFSFRIDTSTSQVTVTPASPLVKGINTLFHVKDGWAFNVGLKRKQ